MSLTDRLKTMIGLGDMDNADDLQAARECMMADSPPPPAKPTFQFKTESGGRPDMGSSAPVARQVLTLGDPSMRSTATPSPAQESALKREPAKLYVINHGELSTLKEDLWCAMAFYEEAYHGLSSELFPQREIVLLTHELHRCTNSQQREAIRSKLAGLSNPHAGPSVASARMELRRTYKLVTRTKTALVEAALKIATAYLTEAIQSETDFYAAWGMGRDATSVSNRVRGVVRELEQLRFGMDLKNLSPNQHMAMRDHVHSPWSDTVIAYFGIRTAHSGDESADALIRFMNNECELLKAGLEQIRRELGEVETAPAMSPT